MHSGLIHKDILNYLPIQIPNDNRTILGSRNELHLIISGLQIDNPLLMLPNSHNQFGLRVRGITPFGPSSQLAINSASDESTMNVSNGADASCVSALTLVNQFASLWGVASNAAI